ncbi:MAG TPA: STELLO glycosyltransferase family protein [Anaerolineaceae bacterium]|nr:STELLO glycosyltransferase family protein [Anaerolineaceae bacterium]HPN53389.1 STELLO glycosyltransferase family protein [Anaerolineaceae bacterium]
MNKFIVITSIFNPTQAVLEFSRKPGYHLIVVGDKKTPVSWQCDNVDYVSVLQQEKSDFNLARILPYQHYCRKMLGYLKAIQSGADYIVDTDDDNIPKDNWEFPEFQGTFDCIADDLGFVNIYQLYTDQGIWARGLPLKLITTQFKLEKQISEKVCNVGVWQGLADEDPDVDAIYRLTKDTPCYFDERAPVVLGTGTISPFNSQNTIFRKELFALMYLPAYVTFRFTDILRGLVAQPIMWLFDYQLGFCNATVTQKRNPHDYMKDFISEIPMYTYSQEVIELVSNSISKSESIESNLYNAYNSLFKENIVCDKEMETLDIWLKDIDKLSRLSRC